MPTVIKKYELILTEAQTNNNKFWRGLLYDDGTGASEWGRVGYTANLTSYNSHSDVERKVREKIKKGYTELKTVSTDQVINSTIKNNELHSIAREQLIKTPNSQLEKLIKRFVDSNIHKITSNTQITYNSSTGLFATPLGIVTQEGILEARNLLSQLAPLIRNMKFDDRSDSLLSKYLRIVPQNLGMKRFSTRSLIPDDNALQKQLDLLDSLESSYQAMQTAPKTNDSTKTQENVFKVDLDILTNAQEIDHIEKWFYSSNRSTHGYSNVRIRNFLKIKIHDNWNNFNEKLGNLKEIWHGTSEANLLSVLKTGLKTSPPSTTVTCGKLFGEGHYGALDSSKSMQYTFGRFTGQYGTSGWLFVGEFAMGNTYFIRSYGGTKPKGYDSIWAKAKDTGLRFDELIVPKDNQVRLKYLLEIK